ncbi:omega-hydroxypalmitate O-feruloyl transferase [Tanacetum coccineum]|uniref:Omega-hydroxypalmitate O-feruloyl transferase n=1 Tax=Tanacetum coccineum TaxID=301880 RepID=A0ABQ5AKC6_9ASTR
MGTLASNVQIKKASLIPPSDPTPTHILKLSSIDSQLFLRFTIEYLLIYPSIRSNIFDQAAFTSRVKAALGRALVPYYPLSGRVRARPDNSCLEVICRGQGAVFIEAESEFNVTDFENAPRYVTEWRKLLALEVTDVLKGCPVLVVQLTWLNDGGVAVGIGFSHCVCDGVGSVEFLNLFAKLSNGCLSRKTTSDLKPKPVWQRSLLDPTSFKEHNPRYATELIKEAKNRVDDKFVKEVVNSVSLKGASCVPDSVGVLILSQWSKLGLESVDFGIGRPVQVGPVCTDRYCILLPVHDHSRSIKVMLAVPSVAVDKYVDLITAVD